MWPCGVFCMPTLQENLCAWNEGYDWPAEGDEWSRPYGNTETMWWFLLLPRIHRFVPAGNLLEIAPGRGRWTRYLKDLCRHYTGVDLSSKCVDYCRERFGDPERLAFHVNNGTSLPSVADESVDFVFSFDSLVHAEADVMDAYAKEFGRVLRPGGTGFIHHSNLGAYPGRWKVYSTLQRLTPDSWWTDDRSSSWLTLGAMAILSLNVTAWRAPSMTAGRFADACRTSGLTVLSQELITWGYGRCPIDCLSTFGKPPAGSEAAPSFLQSPSFGESRKLLRKLSTVYCPEKAARPGAPK